TESGKRRIDALEGIAANPATDGDVALLLASPSSALETVDALDRSVGPFSHELRARIIARGYAHSDPAIRDLFERFIPEEQRVERLEGTIRGGHILGLPG